MTPLNLFHHIYLNNKAEKTLFLLHGTGGDQNDFLFLNDVLKNRYNLVGLKGNSAENGMNRFFRRHAMGVFDQKNIKEESDKLNLFIHEWCKKHDIAFDDITCLGYSNGANMLLATLFYYPDILKNLLLLHPMLPFTPSKELDLKANKMYVSYGTHDEMCPLEETNRLLSLLKQYHAQLIEQPLDSGHELSQNEIEKIVKYLDN